MKITIKVETEESNTEAVFSNEMLDNQNFVDLYLQDKEYTFSVDELYQAIKVFKELKGVNYEL